MPTFEMPESLGSLTEDWATMIGDTTGLSGKSQFPHKAVNLSFISVMIKDTLTDSYEN